MHDLVIPLICFEAQGCHLSGIDEGVGAQSAELCPGLHRQSWWNQHSVPGLPDSKVYALSTVTLG